VSTRSQEVDVYIGTPQKFHKAANQTYISLTYFTTESGIGTENRALKSKDHNKVSRRWKLLNLGKNEF
jgi:hypothetical protein